MKKNIFKFALVGALFTFFTVSFSSKTNAKTSSSGINPTIYCGEPGPCKCMEVNGTTFYSKCSKPTFE